MTTLPGPAMHAVPVFDATYGVRRAGTDADAPPTLLLPGFPFTAAHLQPLQAVLATDRLALAVDLKGVGDSRGPDPYDPLTVAHEIALVLREQVGDSPVDVVGEDWGGLVALALARHHPTIVSRIVLVGAPTNSADALRMLHVGLLSAPVPDVLLRRASGPAVRTLLRAGWSDGRPPPAVIAEAERGCGDRLPVVARYVRAVAGPRLARRMQAGLRARVDRAEDDGLSAPGLLVHGAADPMLPVDLARANAARLGLELALLPGVGHWPLAEAPDATAASIATFLRGGGR